VVVLHTGLPHDLTTQQLAKTHRTLCDFDAPYINDLRVVWFNSEEAGRASMTGKPIHVCVLFALATLLCGCSTIDQQVLTWMPAPPLDGKADEMRMEYQESGSPAAIRWLLAHSVKQGMEPAEVGEALGDTGRRVEDDGWIKNDGGRFQVGDQAYKWGPDNDGNSYFLVFRDHKLVNFNPREFE
jgi:hypothetical protein